MYFAPSKLKTTWFIGIENINIYGPSRFSNSWLCEVRFAKVSLQVNLRNLQGHCPCLCRYFPKFVQPLVEMKYRVSGICELEFLAFWNYTPKFPATKKSHLHRLRKEIASGADGFYCFAKRKFVLSMNYSATAPFSLALDVVIHIH